MWFGTEDGLNRYDGSTFKHFFFSPEGSTPGIPYDFIEASFYCNNNIFVNTRRGGAAYDLKTGAWQEISDGLPFSDIWKLETGPSSSGR